MDISKLPIIDWEQAIKLAGNQKALATEILDLLTQNLPNDMSSINQAYGDQNYHEMLRLVHKLHGGLCYCGLPRLKTLASCLETELKNNIMESLPPLIQSLNNEVSLLLRSVK